MSKLPRGSVQNSSMPPLNGVARKKAATTFLNYRDGWVFTMPSDRSVLSNPVRASSSTANTSALSPGGRTGHTPNLIHANSVRLARTNAEPRATPHAIGHLTARRLSRSPWRIQDSDEHHPHQAGGAYG